MKWTVANWRLFSGTNIDSLLPYSWPRREMWCHLVELSIGGWFSRWRCQRFRRRSCLRSHWRCWLKVVITGSRAGASITSSLASRPITTRQVWHTPNHRENGKTIGRPGKPKLQKGLDECYCKGIRRHFIADFRVLCCPSQTKHQLLICRCRTCSQNGCHFISKSIIWRSLKYWLKAFFFPLDGAVIQIVKDHGWIRHFNDHLSEEKQNK